MAQVAKSPTQREAWPRSNRSTPASTPTHRASGGRGWSLDYIMTEFLQEYPLLTSAVYMEMPGQWNIFEHQVLQLRDAPLKSVLVDGLRRPLGDLLEEVLKEHQLEVSMQAQAQRSQRLLTHVFQHRDRQAIQRLLRSSFSRFQAVARSGRRAREAVHRRRLLLLRQIFLSWRGRVWRQQRKMKDMETLGRHAAPVFRGLLWYAWHSWTAVVFPKHHQQELSLRQQQMLMSTIMAMKVSETFHHEAFQRWRLQVQNDRRVLAEQVLLADAGRLRREMASVGRSASAKELLSHSLSGPEAQLGRLDVVVDQLIGQMNVPSRLSGSRRLAQSDAASSAGSGGASPASPASSRRQHVLHEALLGLGSLLEAQKAASTLRSDIHFVLCLRCLSAWMRFVAEERLGRREADLGARRSEQRWKLRQKAHGLGSQMAKVSSTSRLRDAFRLWEEVLRQQQDVHRIHRERADHAEQLWKYRGVLKDSAVREAKVREGCKDRLLLQLILERWRCFLDPNKRPVRNVQVQDLEQIVCAMMGETEEVLLSRHFVLWRRKARRARTTRSKAFTLITKDQRLHLQRALLAWKRAFRRAKELALKGKTAAAAADSESSFLMLECLHNWQLMVTRAKDARRRDIGKAFGHRVCLLKEATFLEGLRQRVFQRWVEVLVLRKLAQAEFREDRARVGQERCRHMLLITLRRTEAAALWSFLREWHALARITAEERKTAAEYLRRQQLLDVERRLLHFQTETRPRIRRAVEKMVQSYEAMAAAEVFSHWKLFVCHHRLVLASLHAAERRDAARQQKLLLEVWRGSCVLAWLRGAGLRLGQAVVRWGQSAVLQKSVTMWRAVCLKHHAEFSEQQLFAAQRLGHALAKTQRNALRHWSTQVLKVQTAQMQSQVKKMDMQHLASLFDHMDAEVERRHWRRRTIFEAWRLGHDRTRFERNEARHAERHRRGESYPLSSAIRRLARWRRVPEELLARIPETFSAWQIFTALQGQRARARACRASGWRVLRKCVDTQRLLLAFRAFWSLAFRRRKTCERQRVSVLCTAVEVLMLRQVLLSWSSQAHSQWKGRIHREKRIVQASADSLARRLVQVAAVDSRTSLQQSVFAHWRQLSLTQRRLLRYQSARCVRQNLWNDQSLLAQLFLVWKAYFCGLKEPQNARPSDHAEGQGPAQTLRAVLLQQRLGRLRLQGAETVLELRHARQASVFGLWRTHSFLHAHLRRVARPIFGVRRSGMLQALFRSWGNFAERASLARLRRTYGLGEALGVVTLRTLSKGYRELLLRKVMVSWSRIGSSAV